MSRLGRAWPIEFVGATWILPGVLIELKFVITEDMKGREVVMHMSSDDFNEWIEQLKSI